MELVDGNQPSAQSNPVIGETFVYNQNVAILAKFN